MNSGRRVWSGITLTAGLLVLGVSATADPAMKVGVAYTLGNAYAPPAFASTVKKFLATIDNAKTLQFEVCVTERGIGATVTGPRVRRYRVSVAQPDRMAVVPLTPEDARLGVASDGEEVLYYLPTSRQYCLLAAPGTVRGLDRDFFRRDSTLSGVMASFVYYELPLGRAPCGNYDCMAPMGEVEFGGVPCDALLSRVPQLHFFEKNTRGLYRGSLGNTYGWVAGNDDGMSAGWGPVGTMVVSLEKWVVDGPIPGSEFSVTPPAGYERMNDLKALAPPPRHGEPIGPPAPPLAANLPAQTPPAEVRRRAEALCATGYRNSPVVGRLFQRAADGGDALAKMWVARGYARGFFGMPVDRNRAPEFGRTAIAEVKRQAEVGDADAQFLLSGAFMDGLGVAQDPRETVRWTRAAAGQHHVIAMHNLGALLTQGLGVAKDPAAGARWSQQAADAGYPDSMVSSACVYHWGCGVVPDRQKALQWYVRAFPLTGQGLPEMLMLASNVMPHGFTAADLRKVPCVALLGLTTDELPQAVTRSGVLAAGATAAPEGARANPPFYDFPRDGVKFFSRFDRVMTVLMYAEGVDGFSRYKGPLPVGLKWTDTIEEVRKRYGQPDYDRDAQGVDAHSVSFKVEDLDMGVWFTHDEPKRMRSVRVLLGWASPAPAAK